MIVRNSDPVAVSLEVRQLEDLVFVLESFIADCGIPEDDPSESLPAILRTLRAKLEAVPFISFATVGPVCALEAGWDAFMAGKPVDTTTDPEVERARWEAGWRQAQANYGEN